MNPGTNFGQPIEHTIPYAGHFKGKKAYVIDAHGVKERLTLTVDRTAEIPENLIAKVRSEDKRWNKEEKKKKFGKNCYGKKKGSGKAHWSK